MTDEIRDLGKDATAGEDELPEIRFDKQRHLVRHWPDRAVPGGLETQNLRCPFKAERCGQDCVALDVVEAMHNVTGEMFSMVMCNALGPARLGRLPKPSN